MEKRTDGEEKIISVEISEEKKDYVGERERERSLCEREEEFFVRDENIM